MKNSLRLPLSLVFGAGLSLASASATTFLIDLGMGPPRDPVAQGAPTLGQDINGNYWNNLTSTNYANVVQPGGVGSTSLSGLVDTANNSSSIGISFASGTVVWQSSGIANGGLNQNTPVLGNLGIATATQDYYFISGANGTSNATVTLTGLNPLYSYNLGLFATRGDTNDVRTTRFSISGIDKDLQTSGSGSQPADPAVAAAGYFSNNSYAGIYGNEDKVITFDGLVPNGAGELVLTVSIVNGGYAYLGAIELTQVPEPGSAVLGGLGGLLLLSRRRRNAR